MRIGIDFDNTIACYDGVFHRAAVERGLVPPTLGTSKNAVRDHLNGSGRNDAFTQLQGYVYGARMELVLPYPGVANFIRRARRAGHEVFVISHKTSRPMSGPDFDLHAAARQFLLTHGFIGPTVVPPGNIHFEPTKAAKVAAAATVGCDVFVDDLLEILAMPGFPDDMRAVLFDPDRAYAPPSSLAYIADTPSLAVCHDWSAIADLVLGCSQ